MAISENPISRNVLCAEVYLLGHALELLDPRSLVDMARTPGNYNMATKKVDYYQRTSHTYHRAVRSNVKVALNYIYFALVYQKGGLRCPLTLLLPKINRRRLAQSFVLNLLDSIDNTMVW